MKTEPKAGLVLIGKAGGFLKLAARGRPSMKVAVSTAEQIIAIWTQYRDSGFGIGASDMKRGCGDLVSNTGEVIARVTYNGKILDTSGNRIA